MKLRTWSISFARAGWRTVTSAADHCWSTHVWLTHAISVHSSCTIGRISTALRDLRHCSSDIERRRDGTDFLEKNPHNDCNWRCRFVIGVWCGGVVVMALNREVAGSSPGNTTPCNDPGQVVHTHMCLCLPSSINWYRRKELNRHSTRHTSPGPDLGESRGPWPWAPTSRGPHQNKCRID